MRRVCIAHIYIYINIHYILWKSLKRKFYRYCNNMCTWLFRLFKTDGPDIFSVNWRVTILARCTPPDIWNHPNTLSMYLKRGGFQGDGVTGISVGILRDFVFRTSEKPQGRWSGSQPLTLGLPLKLLENPIIFVSIWGLRSLNLISSHEVPLLGALEDAF